MKNKLVHFGAWVSTLPVLLSPFVAGAAPNEGLISAQANINAIGTAIGSDSEADLPLVVGNLINVLLSVLGIIFVVLVVYAGFLYLTAQGDEKKVTKAKDILARAVIGLVIIIAAYSISNFVIGQLVGVASPS